MGYSHYWHRERSFEEEEFLAFGERVSKLLQDVRTFDVPIVGPDDRPDPQVDSERIAFNAFGDAGAVDFVIERVVTPRPGMQLASGLWFESCKTQQHAYDATVTAVLAAAHHRWGGRFEVDSDGYYADWEEGVRLARWSFGDPTIANPAQMPGPDDW